MLLTFKIELPEEHKLDFLESMGKLQRITGITFDTFDMPVIDGRWSYVSDIVSQLVAACFAEEMKKLKSN